MEKTEAIKSKIKSALMYPISVVVVCGTGENVVVRRFVRFRLGAE